MNIISPVVSIITPTYNSASTLRETILGIKSQSFTSWELLVVDDGSLDDSYDIARQFAVDDVRIRVWRLESNAGPATARNVAIEKSQGRYIAFCDSDDVWSPQKLEKQVNTLKRVGAAICFTSYLKISDQGIAEKRVVRAEKQVDYSMMLRSNYIGCSTAIYDTSLCGKVLMPNS